MLSFRRRLPNLIAILLTILAATLDQVAWDWQNYLMVTYCTSRHPVRVDILFSFPFFLLLAGQLLLLYLPPTRRVAVSSGVLIAILVGYIAMIVAMWRDEVWDTEVSQQCMYSVMDDSNLFPRILHWLLGIPCAAYLVVAGVLVIHHRLRLKTQ